MDAFRQALRLLWAHKLRSALTLFGLIWGTASVILLVAWGEGVRLMLEHDVIGNQLTPFHDFLGLQAELGSLRHGRSKQHPGGDMW